MQKSKRLKTLEKLKLDLRNDAMKSSSSGELRMLAEFIEFTDREIKEEIEAIREEEREWI